MTAAFVIVGYANSQPVKHNRLKITGDWNREGTESEVINNTFGLTEAGEIVK